MKSHLRVAFALYLFSGTVLSGPPSLYCPQRHNYIALGMTTDQVLSACGQPLAIKEANAPLYVKVPVTQLIFNNQGTDLPYSWYNNRFAPLKSGSGGVQAEINIVDNKVKLVRVNSSNSNVASVCGGHVKIGDSVARVYSACGSPSIVNKSFIKQAVTTTKKPQIWIFQPGEFQHRVTLTFVDGQLQSID